MSVSQHDWSLHRKGQIDQERHKEKIREAIKKNLGEIVSEEGIILSDGKKMVRFLSRLVMGPFLRTSVKRTASVWSSC